jgi:hypothetical protein
VLHSLTIFEEAIAHNPTEYNSLAKQTEEKTAEQLIEQIIDMLAAHGKGHDAFTSKQERTRLGRFTIPALRTRLADLQTKARMAGHSVTALKAFVADPCPARPHISCGMLLKPPSAFYAFHSAVRERNYQEVARRW